MRSRNDEKRFHFVRKWSVGWEELFLAAFSSDWCWNSKTRILFHFVERCVCVIMAKPSIWSSKYHLHLERGFVQHEEGSETRSCSSADSAPGLLPLPGALQNTQEEMESLVCKISPARSFYLWHEWDLLVGADRAVWLLRAPFPAVFGASGVASAGIGPWIWLEGAEGGQLTAVISPCCSLSAAQALLHCKDIAARQLGRVGRESSQRCQSLLGELNPAVPVLSETGWKK